MLINTDLSTDTTLPGRQRQRAEAGAAASQPSSTAANDPMATQLDPSLQRLTDVSAGALEGDSEIQDEQGAGQAMGALLQGMLQQPGTALAAQANQSYQDVLSLLQPAD